jgi:hypothetical protein
LNATPSTGSVTISWPLFAQDFSLQQVGTGGPLATWTNAVWNLVTNGTGVVASVPVMAGTGSLFRLGK